MTRKSENNTASNGTNTRRIREFHKLLNENLFEYYFQPIVSAKTGEIFAYEALMRTDNDTIGMLPNEILDLAARENRLYEIEKYTFFNILKIMKRYSDLFKSKKLFINSISSHQLMDVDYSRLYAEYSSLLGNVVVEITESTYLDDESLKLIHKRIKEANCQLALDDYGTGYSNELNLLNSNPNFVKIDRTLLHSINLDTKKQHLVYNLINFAKQNHIKVIAEGIESYNELEFVISSGVDYIQGFYTAKPAPILLESLLDETVWQILKINDKKTNDDSYDKIYETNNEAILVPFDIAADKYSSILINDKEILLSGKENQTAEISLFIPNNQKCRLTLENLKLKSQNHPSIVIGSNCNVEIVLKGDNHLYENGIRVPESSDLLITGDGNLTVTKELNGYVCMGGAENQSFGNITLASTGNINAISRGNITVAIGGGLNTLGSVIRLSSGNIHVESSGFNCSGIGCISDNSQVIIENCCLKVETIGTKSIGIGSVTGKADIVSQGNLDISCDGRNSVCIGAFEAAGSSIILKGGTVNVAIHAHTGSGLGSIKGKSNIEIQAGDISIYGEGTELVGIGDHSSISHIRIMNGVLSMLLYATVARLTGNEAYGLVIDGGNIQCDFQEDQTPVNSHGTPLVSHIITDTDEYHQLIDAVSYSYEYRADYSKRFPYIKVYLPDSIYRKQPPIFIK